MKRALGRTAAGIAVVAVVAVVAAAAPGAHAVSPDTSVNTAVRTWEAAANELGLAGSLWAPAFTAGLAQRGRISVVADAITVAQGLPTGGSTFAGGSYGTRTTRIDIAQRWAQTSWGADPADDIRRAPVGNVTVRLGDPGVQVGVRARVFANCYTQATTGNVPPPPASFRCSRADVLRHGGTLIMTARPPSQMTGPGNVTMQIDVQGVSYAQLLRIASSMQQVEPLPTVAPSAQMLGMCAQMVDGSMTLAQASTFAQQNGYTLRPGTVDGEALAVTTDYRPDRFTVTTVRGAVTACTYG